MVIFRDEGKEGASFSKRSSMVALLQAKAVKYDAKAL